MKNGMKKLAVFILVVLVSSVAPAADPMATMEYVTNQVNRLNGRIDTVPTFTDVMNAVDTATSKKLNTTGGTMTGNIIFDTKENTTIGNWQLPKYGIGGPYVVITGYIRRIDSNCYVEYIGVCE